MTENTCSFDEIGKEFENYDKFLEEFNEFCRINYQPMTIATNNKRQVTILCRHGRKRETSSSGKRTHLHYNYLACGAKISCYKPANSSRVRITYVDLNHNHEVSKSAFDTFGVELNSKNKPAVDELATRNDSPILFSEEDAISEEEFTAHKSLKRTLNNREKYNLILSILLNIASLASYHGTEQFMEYLSDMKKIEDTIRAGCSVAIECAEQEVGENTPEVPPQSPTNTTPLPHDSPSPSTSQASSRFQGLKFASNVKVRGRPKRPVRQLCSFNKTVGDSEPKTQDKRKRKTKNTTTSKNKKRKVGVSKEGSGPCPVCGDVLLENVTFTDCCLMPIHTDCLSELNDMTMCPECTA